jgi:SAM-dependent methyltransferase
MRSVIYTTSERGYHMDKPYYQAYEARYQKVYKAGANCWGHSPDDENLKNALKNWVEKNHLHGKRILEFACGEGASGVILSQLGCQYHGIDLAPSALEKAKLALTPYPDATVSKINMVKQSLEDDPFDASLDVSGIHMLITDHDRSNYLKNAFRSLKPNAPMLFLQESYWKDEEEVMINSLEEWAALTGDDYETPQPRTVLNEGTPVEILIPILPARGRSKKGYLNELQKNGFIVDDFMQSETLNSHSITIYTHRSL